MNIKAILSDLDKTLIEDTLVPEQVIRVVKTYLEIPVEKAEQLVMTFYNTQTTKTHFLNGYSKVGAWKHVFEQHDVDYSYDQLFELNDIFWKTAAKYARPFPGVMESLKQLKMQGYLLGVVSGGDYITRYQHLKETGILPLVDMVVTTEEIGQQKHGYNLYSVAAKELGVSYQEALTIGDNEIADIVLPKEEGFLTVKVDPDKNPTVAHFRIDTFPQLEDILKNDLTQQLLP